MQASSLEEDAWSLENDSAGGDNPVYDAGAQAAGEQAETNALLANVMFGLGGACLAAGTLIWLLSDDDEEQVAIVPAATPGGAGLVVVGEF